MQIVKATSGYARKMVHLIVVVLLCLSSAVGVSYALFTSNLEDGTIGINATSGKVDVDLVNVSGVSLVGSVLHLTPNGKELEEFRFEPGSRVYTEGFRVVNNGNVTTNIRMYISHDERIDEVKFAQAFEIYITKDIDDLEHAEQLMSYEGRLLADASTDIYYLVIRMRETADDTFQGVEYSGIGVTVYAVQGNVEIT